MKLTVSEHLSLDEDEIEFSAVRSQGAGGQNVNKVSSAAHLRFDIHRSSLPEPVKTRLAALPDHRIRADGVIVIKAQQRRSLEQNRADALGRLLELIRQAERVPKVRKPTRPSRAAKRRRLEGKVQRGRVKSMRSRVRDPES